MHFIIALTAKSGTSSFPR